MEKMIDILQREKLVAILRHVPYKASIPVIEALINGNIRMVEVTLNSDSALHVIEEAKETFGSQAYVGAGTVLTLDMAKEAVSAGAEYLVSPNVDEAVIDYAVSQKVDIWPGAFTATEIVKAYEAGASAVKVFPAGSMGPGYIKDLKGPLNHIPMMVTGGINEKNVKAFLQAGACSAGFGGNLVNSELIKKGDYESITSRAKQLSSLVKEEQQNDR